MGPTHGTQVDLYKFVRKRRVLLHAWSKVRASGLSSTREKTKKEIAQFDSNAVRNIEAIAERLRRSRFNFSNELGFAPPKGAGKSGHRPIVVAPVENRVVRRAILDVLQGFQDSRGACQGVPAIVQIMETPTSIGGIAKRGVPHGLKLVKQAITDKRHYFSRSDISNFFTRIDTSAVIAFVREHVQDQDFIDLFEGALKTNLSNQDELEERGLYKLFPDPEIGVAQGSALSALAGNIALREFDKKFNDRDIVCIRYIDDFILLGSSPRKVDKAFESARSFLAEIGMQVYDTSGPDAGKSGKAHRGDIWDGTDFLGYHVRGHSLRPCDKAQKNIIDKIHKSIGESGTEIKKVADGQRYDHSKLYAQTLAWINRVCWGWSQSFGHTTDTQTLIQMDVKIDAMLSKYRMLSEKQSGRIERSKRRKILGVCLLGDLTSKRL